MIEALKPLRISIFTICLVLPLMAGAASFRDSIRTEQYKNHTVIIYRVSSKETIYSIARRYSLPPKEIIALNDGHQSLRVGDEIRVPSRIALAATETPKPFKTNQSAPEETSHTVEKGETLYSISRLYGMQPLALQRLNDLADPNVRLGQVLTVIPYKEPNGSAVSKTPNQPAVQQPLTQPVKLLLPATGLYVVQAHETVFAIGARYGIPVARIVALNQLANDEIHTGQTLKLRQEAGEPVSQAKPDSGQQEKAETAESRLPAIPKAVIPAINQPEITLPANEPNRGSHPAKEIREAGLGLWLNNNDLNQARSVALHRTAPVGTIVKVTNPMSRKSIFVKVVGSFPDTAENKDAVVIISKSAADLIGALDQRFRVELSYVD